MGLGENLSGGHRLNRDGHWMPVWLQRPMLRGQAAGGRIATPNTASSAILPWVSVVSCHLFKSQNSSYFIKLAFLLSVF